MSYLFGFSGRFGRLQWWSIQLIMVATYILFAFAVGFSLSDMDQAGMEAFMAQNGLAFLGGLAAVVVFCVWINIAATVKRYHDRDKSGFWFLIVFIPFIGGIWQLIECGFLSGSPGGNSFGTRRAFDPSFLEREDGFGDAPQRSARLAAEPERRLDAIAERPRKPSTGFGRPQPVGFGRRGL